MRKFLISLMAASALVPAAAQAEDGSILRGMRNHAERSSQRNNDSDINSSQSQPQTQPSNRSNDDRPARVERSPRGDRAVRTDRVRQIERTGGADGNTGTIERAWRAHRGAQQIEPVQAPEQVQPTQRVGDRDGLADGFSRVGRDTTDGRTRDRNNDSDNHRDWRRDRDGDGRHGWSRDWRRDHRYDWSGYRNRYRSLFRLGHYYDPYGYNYRRFSIGFNLWPSYYGSNFWLDDPWMYRLPPAYGPYRWVRYYDDAMLVDIYTGRVVDVIHNVFW